jgi:anti-sigma B factor antagonist
MKSVSFELDGIPVLELEGRFDAHTVSQVKDWIGEYKTIHSYLIVNLAEATFVDSAALATLVQGMKQCRELGGDLFLCHLAQPVRIIFELTRLDQAFTIFDSVHEAVAATKLPQIAIE